MSEHLQRALTAASARPVKGERVARGGDSPMLARKPSYDHPGGGRLPSLLSARALRYLAAHPGSSGRAVGRGLGIRHDSQTWALLHRLERAGLLAKKPNGTATAWTVTQQGHQLLRNLPDGVYADEAPSSGPQALSVVRAGVPLSSAQP